MMKQYAEAKRACPDALLLFRMGDFYEMFYEDAKTAARVLNLALTSREKGAGAIPMAGFPHHQLESYLGKLLAAGFRVAVCDQVEDPKLAKGLVRREVTRIVTPGTLTDEALLNPCENNFLAAVADGEPAGLAWVELSTGKFLAAAYPLARLADQLERLAPAECLLSENYSLPAENQFQRMMLTRRPAWAFSAQNARQSLCKHFGVGALEGFGFTDSPADTQAIRAAGAVLDYLQETQKNSLAHVERLTPYRVSDVLELDQATRRGLEITRTFRDGQKHGSLLWVLDHTRTAMGSRLLAEWLSSPLTDVAAIRRRLDAVETLVRNPSLAMDLQEWLGLVYDLERLLTRAVTGRATPRDISFLGRTLNLLPRIKARLLGGTRLVSTSAEQAIVPNGDMSDVGPMESELLKELEEALDPCEELARVLSAALRDDCPLNAREGGIIREGYHAELDGLRELALGGKKWIARYQAHEAERTGIPNLKVGYNQVFGYYIEVTNAHRDKVPLEYIRKQTIKNAERYITPELKEYEEQVLTADERAKELEYELFQQLREQVAAARRRIQTTAAALAQLDVLAGLAELARQRNYCRPEVVAEPVLNIRDGRHPMLDILQPEGEFVPNDTVVSAAGESGETAGEEGSILLITGPNMAGKSTYIRQVALLTLMAQLGSFIPARSAVIGVADRIFARIGAGDELGRGQSTFMVEMIEAARILNTAGRRSLVVLDEIGRGTSTYDGISLAWSMVEYLHAHVGCRTLFATHYHELTDLEKSLSGVKNFNVAVREWREEVVFLHRIVPGAADKSYGIHVARLAGVPREVIQRAKGILALLEEEHLDAEGRAKITRQKLSSPAGDRQLLLFAPFEHPLLDELRALDLNNLTPLAAFELLQRWQALLKKEAGDEK